MTRAASADLVEEDRDADLSRHRRRYTTEAAPSKPMWASDRHGDEFRPPRLSLGDDLAHRIAEPNDVFDGTVVKGRRDSSQIR